jgi:hypothetical protein
MPAASARPHATPFADLPTTSCAGPDDHPEQDDAEKEHAASLFCAGIPLVPDPTGCRSMSPTRRPEPARATTGRGGAAPCTPAPARPCWARPFGGDELSPARGSTSAPMSRLGLSVGRGTPESRAWPTTTWTVLILILPRRKRSPRCCARLARCPGAPTSWAIPPQRWMTPRPSSSLLRPAPTWSSSCTTSWCSNASCSDARGRQDVEIISRVPDRLRAGQRLAVGELSLWCRDGPGVTGRWSGSGPDCCRRGRRYQASG